jgi:FkbM family methyltransferase
MKIANICNHSFLADPLPRDRDAVVGDLGANNGMFSAEMTRRFRCRVVAAEPVPELYQRIVEMGLPQITIRNVAITGKSAVGLSLNIYDNRCASLLPPRFSADSGIAVGVTSESLGDFLTPILSDKADAKIDLLKVDIEGSELEMFEAAEDRELLSCAQVTVEFHQFFYPETLERIEAIKARFSALGFFVIDFSTINTDVLFINRYLNLSWIDKLQLYFTKYRRGIKRRLSVLARKPSKH